MNYMIGVENNSQINSRLQLDNDPISETFKEGKALLHFLNALNNNLELIHHKIAQTQIDVDMYLYEPNSGSVALQSATTPGGFRGPFHLTDVIANWNTNSPVSAAVEGNATGPGALATIGTASVLLQPGTYTADWEVGFGAGAVAAADANNFRLFGIPAPVQAIIPAVANTTVPQQPVTFTLTTATTVGIQAIGAGTATANYSAQLTITGTTTAQTVTLTIKERTIPLLASAGSFQLSGLTGSMLIDDRDKITLTVSPAAPCFLEVLGNADYRKIDRQET